MKKAFVFMILCIAMAAKAQYYEVGQIVPQGTWDAVVVYVDESGQHGLLMSPTALREGTLVLKKIAKHLGLSIEDFTAQYPLPILSKGEKDAKIAKIMKEMMKQNMNGTNGVENCQNIADYCETNGIPMDVYFPELTWASSLGEGWFIPGTDELELYAKSIAKGVGKKNYKGNLHHSDDHRKELDRKLTTEYNSGFGLDKMVTLYFPQNICSSTFACNKTFEKANKDKIAKVNGLSIAGNISYIYFGLSYFRNNFGQGWYVLNKKGIDYQIYTNAFKWF